MNNRVRERHGVGSPLAMSQDSRRLLGSVRDGPDRRYRRDSSLPRRGRLSRGPRFGLLGPRRPRPGIRVVSRGLPPGSVKPPVPFATRAYLVGVVFREPASPTPSMRRPVLSSVGPPWRPVLVAPRVPAPTAGFYSHSSRGPGARCRMGVPRGRALPSRSRTRSRAGALDTVEGAAAVATPAGEREHRGRA